MVSDYEKAIASATKKLLLEVIAQLDKEIPEIDTPINEFAKRMEGIIIDQIFAGITAIVADHETNSYYHKKDEN